MKITRYENAIFGLRPIIEAIQAGKEIDTLFIQKGLKNELFQELWQLVRAHKVNYKHVPVEKLNRLTRKNHQGVFAFISPISFHKTGGWRMRGVMLMALLYTTKPIWVLGLISFQTTTTIGGSLT